MDVLEKPKTQESELEELGFSLAAKNLKGKRELVRKMRIAFEFFRVVTPENVKRFNEELLECTKKSTDRYGSYTYQRLVFTPVQQYGEIPPPEALSKLREAKQKNCFDQFVVATIATASVSRVPDPILFGTIDGDQNYYFIAQWDDDVKIEDILKEDEG